jgi:hypothetical protein
VSSKFLPSVFACILSFLALPLAAQDDVAQSKPIPRVYTAHFKVTRVQTLANGSTITHESTEIWARDASGRT